MSGEVWEIVIFTLKVSALSTLLILPIGIDADQLAADLLKAGKENVPDYAFDCHTLKGKRQGVTKADFFREEQKALKPFQPGLFDDLAGT